MKWDDKPPTGRSVRVPTEIHAPVEHAHICVLQRFPGARLATKVNAAGELVIAIILPPRTPGEWTEKQREIDEENRRAREAHEARKR